MCAVAVVAEVWCCWCLLLVLVAVDGWCRVLFCMLFVVGLRSCDVCYLMVSPLRLFICVAVCSWFVVVCCSCSMILCVVCVL